MIGTFLPEQTMGLFAQLTRHKTIEQLQSEASGRGDFRRVLGVWQLTAIGLGGIIGVGVFVLAGQQAAANAGPAVALAFIIAGIASAAAALCYAEFAGMIPVTGSAYTYGYAVLGEGVAWLIGWDLLARVRLDRRGGRERLVGLPAESARGGGTASAGVGAGRDRAPAKDACSM